MVHTMLPNAESEQQSTAAQSIWSVAVNEAITDY